jgi:hypothetical protein
MGHRWARLTKWGARGKEGLILIAMLIAIGLVAGTLFFPIVLIVAIPRLPLLMTTWSHCQKAVECSRTKGRVAFWPPSPTAGHHVDL